MYTAYWNLRELPFQNVADPRFAYLSEQHHEGLARLIYLANSAKLGGVLTGPYGVGKSMVLELLAQQLRAEKQLAYVYINVVPGAALGLARQIASRLGLDQSQSDLPAIFEMIRNLCENPRSGFRRTLLAIDEVQMVRHTETYEFLHLLTNLSLPVNGNHPLQSAFTLIIAGHMDLTRQMGAEKSLCQRLPMVWNLEPLSETQTLEYIQHRVRTAGGDIWIFEEGILPAIYAATGGLPRMINNLCDMALMLGAAAQSRTIGAEIIRQAVANVHSALFDQPVQPEA